MARGPGGDCPAQHPKTKDTKARRWRLLILSFLCCAVAPPTEDSVEVGEARQKTHTVLNTPDTDNGQNMLTAREINRRVRERKARRKLQGKRKRSKAAPSADAHSTSVPHTQLLKETTPASKTKDTESQDQKIMDAETHTNETTLPHTQLLMETTTLASESKKIEPHQKIEDANNHKRVGSFPHPPLRSEEQPKPSKKDMETHRIVDEGRKEQEAKPTKKLKQHQVVDEFSHFEFMKDLAKLLLYTLLVFGLVFAALSLLCCAVAPPTEDSVEVGEACQKTHTVLNTTGTDNSQNMLTAREINRRVREGKARRKLQGKRWYYRLFRRSKAAPSADAHTTSVPNTQLMKETISARKTKDTKQDQKIMDAETHTNQTTLMHTQLLMETTSAANKTKVTEQDQKIMDAETHTNQTTIPHILLLKERTTPASKTKETKKDQKIMDADTHTNRTTPLYTQLLKEMTTLASKSKKIEPHQKIVDANSHKRVGSYPHPPLRSNLEEPKPSKKDMETQRIVDEGRKEQELKSTKELKQHQAVDEFSHFEFKRVSRRRLVRSFMVFGLVFATLSFLCCAVAPPTEDGVEVGAARQKTHTVLNTPDTDNGQNMLTAREINRRVREGKARRKLQGKRWYYRLFRRSKGCPVR
ncbi:uncharacterized protein LOC134452224 [Engraulis encrasicolus]|uniref:uncharacterized protein LOC134452224 n=1 Tax=Engraulis encrasicolus TaxID=184585 RepID=UPI002FD77391